MKKLFVILFFSLAIVTYGQEQSVQLSAGVCFDAGYFFGSTQTNSSQNIEYNFNNRRLGFNAFIGAEILTFALIEAKIYNVWENSRSGDTDPQDIHRLGVTFSLMGQYPFYIDQNIRVSPLFGFELDLRLFYDSDSVESSWRGDHDILKNNDQVFLIFGGAIDYFLTNNIAFHSRLFYNVQLYRRWVAEDTNSKQTNHGPRVMLGVKYVF